jgi:hypothetical protein
MCYLLRALRTAPCSAIRVKGRTVTGAHTTNHMLLNRTRTKAFVSCGLIISAMVHELPAGGAVTSRRVFDLGNGEEAL